MSTKDQNEAAVVSVLGRCLLDDCERLLANEVLNNPRLRDRLGQLLIERDVHGGVWSRAVDCLLIVAAEELAGRRE